jgi:hypothetical protein
MEETGMCFPIHSATVDHPRSTLSPAKGLGPDQRREVAIQALAGTVPIATIAGHAQISRKFVYRQKTIASDALANAFDSPPADDKVLFQLPVTKSWLQQFVLGLVLIGHSPLRGVVEIFRDFLDYDISLGTVHNIVSRSVEPARHINDQMDLSPVRVGAHDEIFQKNQPVLVGVDARSTYCYLLSREDHRDADTWGVRLLDLKERGLSPDAVVADAGRGLRAGLAAALPGVPCRSDVFHALREVHKVVSLLENRAYRAVEARDRLRRKVARSQSPDPALLARLARAIEDEARAIEWADQIALLAHWLRNDVLALAGPPHPDRIALYDFIRAELNARVSAAPPRQVGPLPQRPT